MDDYNASDMRYGDLTKEQLLSQYRLDPISERVDPYTMTQLSSMDRPQSMFCCNMRGSGKKITPQQCVAMLFDEFRSLSHQFSFYGPYKHLIKKMINHMQNNSGRPFRDIALNNALKEHIIQDNCKENSTRLLLEKALSTYIDWDKKNYPTGQKNELHRIISEGRLPKFNRSQDRFNGMRVTVHDTWSTHITIKSLNIDNNHFRAVVHYKVQDHFGLDNCDILKKNSNSSVFFVFGLYYNGINDLVLGHL